MTTRRTARQTPPGTARSPSARRVRASPSGGDADATVLVATKLHRPHIRHELVPRDSLVRRVSGSGARVTLIQAPPGWGKTTLLAEWSMSADENRPFAWLALEPAENDPARFWTYVIEALRTLDARVGARPLAALQAPAAHVDAVLAELVNELSRRSAAIVLVFDDYHVITNSQIHQGMAFFIEHLPPNLHLVIATRSEPPLPFARLRARGEVADIRAEDLRFSEQEAAALLNGTLHLDLAPLDVRRLWNRTEGWAAGLYLAALSVRGREDAHAFVEAFAGDDRHVVDYLGTEVVASQAEEVRLFLLRTSILDRLCGPLCDAVLDTSGSVRLLQQVERSNLFLVPLDSKRRWYRYHHLFAELLRLELSQAEPDLVPVLHRRASAWYRGEGLVSEAIRHAIAAGAFDEAADLIATNWGAFIQRGRAGTVVAWLNALPPSIVIEDARLCLASARTAMYLRRFEQVDAWIEAAERAAERAPDGTDVAVEPAVALFRAARYHALGDVKKACDAARTAVELEPDEAVPWRPMALAAFGITLYWSGEPDAEEVLQDALRVSGAAGDMVTLLAALGYLAAVRAERDDLDEADRLLDHAASIVNDQPALAEFMTTVGLIGRGNVLEKRGHIVEADAAITLAVSLSRESAGLIEIAYGLLALSRVRRRKGGADADALLREARRVMERCPDPGILAHMLAEAEAAAAAPRTARPSATEELTDRELAVLRLLSTQLSLREIAETLFVSHNTVKTHTRGIYRKLVASTRAEAVANARAIGLL